MHQSRYDEICLIVFSQWYMYINFEHILKTYLTNCCYVEHCCKLTSIHAVDRIHSDIVEFIWLKITDNSSVAGFICRSNVYTGKPFFLKFWLVFNCESLCGASVISTSPNYLY